MTSRRWGFKCPVDGGILLDHADWGDRLWCPGNNHGGNGAFFTPAEATEGWEHKMSGTGLSQAQIRSIKAAAQADVDEAEAADTPKVGGAVKAAQAKAERDAAKKSTPRAAAAPKPPAEPKLCTCGCGGQTKGGRFIPGHDARWHSRIRQLEAQGVDHEEAAKIASKGPLTGKYAAAVVKANEEREAAKAAAKAAKTAAAEATEAPPADAAEETGAEA